MTVVSIRPKAGAEATVPSLRQFRAEVRGLNSKRAEWIARLFNAIPDEMTRSKLHWVGAVLSALLNPDCKCYEWQATGAAICGQESDFDLNGGAVQFFSQLSEAWQEWVVCKTSLDERNKTLTVRFTPR